MNLIEFLSSYMKRMGMTDIGLAIALGYKSNSPVSMVLRGERKISRHKIVDWADALKLKGQAREDFLELAHLELTPAWLQQQYWKLKGRVESAEKRVSDLDREVQEVRNILERIRRIDDN